VASLYQKWRSSSFDDLIGQEHVVRTLRNAVRQHRIAHAYLFTGPRGTGKTSTARILAKAVNCLQTSDGNPCNECRMCRTANDGRAMDVIEIDAASNTSVDNVRDLRERVAYAAGEGRYKVYIVDEVHRLSAAAFDAFLKTLEEPPPHVIFVFASTEPHKVPDTITSRCQRFDFRRIASSDTYARLRFVAEREDLQVSEEALRLIAQHAYGSLRDALGLLDQVASYTEGEITDSEVRAALGLADAGIVDRLTTFLLEEEVGSGLDEFHRFVDAGGDPRQATRQFVDYWRALLLQVTRAASSEGLVDPALAARLPVHASRLGESQVVAVLRAMVDQEYSPKFNIPSQLPFELGYVQAALALQSNSSSIHTRSLSAPEVPKPAAESRPPAGVARSTGQLNGKEPGVEDRPFEPAGSVPPSVQPFAAVESAWDAIVANMRSRSRSLQAILRSGVLLRAGEGQITIGFLHDFHRNQFADKSPAAAEKRRLVEEVVENVLGASYRVNYVRTTREEVEALRGVGALEEDDGFVDEVAERLREYHARELGSGNS